MGRRNAASKKNKGGKTKTPSAGGKSTAVVVASAKKKATKRQRRAKKSQPQPEAEPEPEPVSSPDPTPQIRLEHIDIFFAQFPDFQHNPFGHPSSEFKRLCQSEGWDFKKGRVDDEATEARDQFQAALVNQFNTTFGRDENNLELWQELCQTLEYNNIPDTLTECQELVMNTHINLVDLLANKSTGATVHKFPSEVALSKYTIENGRFFPRNDVKAGSFLKKLLRRIHNPTGDHSLKSGRRRFRGNHRG